MSVLSLVTTGMFHQDVCAGIHIFNTQKQGRKIMGDTQDLKKNLQFNTVKHVQMRMT